MKLVSLTAIIAYVVFAALRYDDTGSAFWNTLYGFAVMLAVFNLLNLKIKWAAAFGSVAYLVVAYKMSVVPVETSNVSSGPLYIAGLVAAAAFCLGLLIFEVKKIRQPFDELPDGNT